MDNKTQCKWCGRNYRWFGAAEDVCDFCWDLESRIKRQPDIARRMLAVLDQQSATASDITPIELFSFEDDDILNRVAELLPSDTKLIFLAQFNNVTGSGPYLLPVELVRHAYRGTFMIEGGAVVVIGYAVKVDGAINDADNDPFPGKEYCGFPETGYIYTIDKALAEQMQALYGVEPKPCDESL